MKKLFALSAFAAFAVTLAAGGGCDPHEPSRATIVNELPAEGATSFTVEKAWYHTTLFVRPVPPGTSSETLSVGFGNEPAYFVLAIGEPPQRILAQTNEILVLDRGEQMRIPVNPERIRSRCVGTPIGRQEWTFIKERIFPGDEVLSYDDPCPAPAPSGDGGVEGGAGGTEGGATDAATD